MPRFYIHFQNGDFIVKDDQGEELPGLEEAKEAAIVSAREILADNLKANAANPLSAVMIANENGETIMTISAKDVMPESFGQKFKN
jgi:hypothetical protein